DAYSILLGYVDNRRQVEKTVALKGWQKQFGEDKNSSTHPKQLESFKVKKLIGNSRFENSSWYRSNSGLICNSCTSSWVTGKLNGGSAKVGTQENSSLTTVVGEVKKDKNYILKFKAASNKEGSLRIFLRHSGSPWEVVSPATTVEVSQDTKE